MRSLCNTRVKALVKPVLKLMGFYTPAMLSSFGQGKSPVIVHSILAQQAHVTHSHKFKLKGLFWFSHTFHIAYNSNNEV
jgi:hypothetical protein